VKNATLHVSLVLSSILKNSNSSTDGNLERITPSATLAIDFNTFANRNPLRTLRAPA
jgi:hypothetical protein